MFVAWGITARDVSFLSQTHFHARATAHGRHAAGACVVRVDVGERHACSWHGRSSFEQYSFRLQFLPEFSHGGSSTGGDRGTGTFVLNGADALPSGRSALDGSRTLVLSRPRAAALLALLISDEPRTCDCVAAHDRVRGPVAR